ncbi:MAG: methyltransferase domain-containing protein [Acetobacteraceae bacterium]
MTAPAEPAARRFGTSLAVRSSTPERMDTDCRDYADYAACLRDLSRVNVVTLTHRPMLRWLTKQAAEQPDFSLLDIACGHGDALRQIRRRFPQARLTGIDLNPWAVRAATEATTAEAAISFIHDDAFRYVPETPFDFIITSQFTHHLTDTEVVDFLRWLPAHTRRGWFIGDVLRNIVAYYGFPLLARVLFWHRFIREDGQISIARSFRMAEWRTLIAEAGVSGVTLRRFTPFRICISSP